ncbi:MAG: GumC family protein [Alphaproteobacteria bacterium]
MQQSFSLGDYLAILRRRIWWFLIPCVLIVAAAAAAALTWPPVYRSTAMVLIEEAEIPDRLVDVSFDSYVDRRLESITRQVMVTDNLVDIIERFNLYPEMRAEEPLTAVAGRMRGDVGIRRIAAERGEATVAFEVYFDYEDPAIARRVTDEVVSLYLNENIRQRRELITGTAQFFARERTRVEERIDDLSQRLAAFKSEHTELLPQQAAANERRLAGAETALRELDREEQSLIDRETILMAQLAQIDPRAGGGGGGAISDPRTMLEDARVQLGTLRARYADTHPDVVRTRAEVAALEEFVTQRDVDDEAEAEGGSRELSARRRQLERELASLERIYGPSHPDVQATQRQLDEVRARQDEGSEGGAASADAGAGSGNAAYLSMEARLAVVRRQLDTLDERRAEARERIAHFGERLDRMPQVELEYNEIAGALDDARARRNALLEKEQMARLSEAVEAEERGERFSLIEPANLPNAPAEPDRRLILLAGLVLGTASGGGAVAARHVIDDKVSGPGDIAREIGFEPLGIVPNITTPAERLLRIGRRIAVVAVIVAGTGAGAWVVHRQVVPLDTAAMLAWREVGSRVGPYLPSDLQAQLGFDGS